MEIFEVTKDDLTESLEVRIRRAFKNYEAELEKYPNEKVFTAERLEDEIDKAIRDYQIDAGYHLRPKGGKKK